MGSLTGEQIKDFVIVALAVISFVVLTGNLVKTIKELKKPQDDLRQWQRDVDTKLTSDNDRLKAMEDGNKVICRGILALLSHEINGNSVDKLKSSQTEITNYLIDR